MKKAHLTFFGIAWLCAHAVFAQQPPGPPASSNGVMYTTGDLFNRLAYGSNGVLAATAFTPPVAGPGPSGYSLNELMAVSPTQIVGGAVVGDVRQGRIFWGVSPGQWGMQTGGIPTQALSPETPNVPAGYYEATNLTAVDADLIPAHIIMGIAVFGLTGTADKAVGNATIDEVIAGRVFSITGESGKVGIMPRQVLLPTTAVVPFGYYQTTNLVQVDPDLATHNIRAGITLFGVNGSASVVDTSSGDATAPDIRTGLTAWVQGEEITGSMPTRMLSASTTAVSAGYYDATDLGAVDADFVSGNIRAGTTLFGVPGFSNVVDTSSGTASSSDLLLGRRAWVNGRQIIGVIASRVMNSATTLVQAGYYAATNLNDVEPDLVSGNIRAGTMLFGVPGFSNVVDTSSGTADAAGILTGQLAWVAGQAVTGAMPVRVLAPTSLRMESGYYAATNLNEVDPELAPGHVISNIVIFGVTGTAVGASGNALESEVLAGSTFSRAGQAGLIGTMPIQTLAATTTAVQAGYYASTDLVAVEPDLVSAHITAGVQLFGITGSADVAVGDASTWDVISGRVFSVTGHAGLLGTMPRQVLSPASAIVPFGYYATTNLVQVDPDLATHNIRGGISLFGVNGSASVVDTSSGDAAAPDIRTGLTAWVQGLEITGSMPTRMLSAATTAVAAGYYDATDLGAVDADFVAGNIRAGTTLFGVPGFSNVVDTSSGTAGASDVLLGRRAWVNGQQIIGIIPTRVMNSATTLVLAGYYTATNLAQVETNLVSGNLRAGTTVFGVGGSTTVVETAGGTAASGDILAGQTAWANGTALTGSMPVQTLSSETTTVAAGYYALADLAAVETNLVSGNLRAGIRLFGIPGASNVVDTSSGNATADGILTGQLAWVDGQAITGAMPIRVLTPNTLRMESGYYAATNLNEVDPELIPGHVISNVVIFGVTGTAVGASGTALESEVLEGSTFSRAGEAGLVGTMPVRTLAATTTTVQAGYYAATDLVTVEPDLTSGHVLSGITLFGIAGSAVGSIGNALASQVLTGSVFSIAGQAGLVGSMPNQAGASFMPATTNQGIAEGYYDGTGVVWGDPDLASGNIRAGITLFGVPGDSNVVDTETADAEAWELLAGRSAFVAGQAVTGSMPWQIVNAQSPALPAGYYSATNLVQVNGALQPANIRVGVGLFGQTGTMVEALGDAQPAQVLSGSVFSIAGQAGLTGSMPNIGAVVVTPTTNDLPLAAGYHDGNGYVIGDAQLASGNIRSGVELFGVEGSPTVVDTAGTTAQAINILTGRTAWVNGALLTGMMPGRLLNPQSSIVLAGAYAATNLTQVNENLDAQNILAGIGIFGVTGTAVEATGNALPSQVLTGSTYSIAGQAGLAGTMANRGGLLFTPATTNQTIAEGYHNGAGYVLGDADLASSNIRAGITLFGIPGDSNVVNTGGADAEAWQLLTGHVAFAAGRAVTGSMPWRMVNAQSAALPDGYYSATNLAQVNPGLQATNIRQGVALFGQTGTIIEALGNAQPAQVLAGSVFSIAGQAGLAGSMPNIGEQVVTPTTSDVAIAAGYHDGTGHVVGDPQLIQGNIRAGVELFGVEGSPTVVDTAGTTAQAINILTGRTAWVNGTRLTGMMPGRLLNPHSPVVLGGAYAATNLTQVNENLDAHNIVSGIGLFGITGTAVEASGNAIASQVMSGRVFSVSGAAGLVGTLPTCLLSATTTAVQAGYYAATSLTQVETNLISSNIRFGARIFGIEGSAATNAQYLAKLARTGQTNSYQAADDGALQAGVAWASPRFTDNGDGTVTDHNTGLMWLKDANHFGAAIWYDAINLCTNLATGGHTDWRLPNRWELLSLVDHDRADPALPLGHPFSSVVNTYYWTSTTYAKNITEAWMVDFRDGQSYNRTKPSSTVYVWPVRTIE